MLRSRTQVAYAVTRQVERVLRILDQHLDGEGLGSRSAVERGHQLEARREAGREHQQPRRTRVLGDPFPHHCERLVLVLTNVPGRSLK